MIDPVSCVGLAAAVAQFITFSCSVAALALKMRDSQTGAAQDPFDLAKTCSALRTLAASLKTDPIPPHKSQTLEVRTSIEALEGIAGDCEGVCDDLLKALEALKAKKHKGTFGRFDCLMAALRFVWNQREMKRFEEKLVRYQTMMLPHTLVLLKHQSDQLEKKRWRRRVSRFFRHPIRVVFRRDRREPGSATEKAPMDNSYLLTTGQRCLEAADT